MVSRVTGQGLEVS